MAGYLLSPNLYGELVRIIRWWRAQGGASSVGIPGAPPLPNLLRRFELKEDLTPGGTVDAYLLLYADGAEGRMTPDSGTPFTFEVEDHSGGLSALGAVVSPATAGAKGVAWKPADRAAWEILSIQQRAKMICGTLAGALTTTTASQTITSPVAMDGGMLPSGTVTGYNAYTTAGFAGDSGGRCVVAWNENTDHYEFIDVECPA